MTTTAPIAPAPGELVLGIDFGTCYARAAAVIDGKIQLVLDGGDTSFPSVVYLPQKEEPVVGRDALRFLSSEPSSTVTSIKRLLGRAVTDSEVKVVNAGVGYQIKAGPTNMAVLHINGSDYAPAQVAAAILTRLRKLAERRFGGTIRFAVLTAPAEAAGEYLVALKRAAALARLNVLQFIAEPVAAALAFGLHKTPCDRRIAVYDFGGGTFDSALVQQQGMEFKAVGYAGDPFLGGEDFDSALAEAVAGVVHRKHGVDLHRDLTRWRELLLRCESVKRQLSSQSEVRLRLRDGYGGAGGIDLDLLVERSWVEPRWQPLVDRSLEVFGELLGNTRWAVTDVEEVILVGGTTLVPMVREGCCRMFQRQVRTSERADVAVAVGAALQAAAHSVTRPNMAQTPVLTR